MNHALPAGATSGGGHDAAARHLTGEITGGHDLQEI